MSDPTCARDTPGKERTRCGRPTREQPYYMVAPTLRAEDGEVLVGGGAKEVHLCPDCVEELAAAISPFLLNAERTALRQTLDFEDRFGQPWSAEMLRALASTMRHFPAPSGGRLPKAIEAELHRIVNEHPELYAQIRVEVAAIRAENRYAAENRRKARS